MSDLSSCAMSISNCFTINVKMQYKITTSQKCFRCGQMVQTNKFVYTQTHAARLPRAINKCIITETITLCLKHTTLQMSSHMHTHSNKIKIVRIVRSHCANPWFFCLIKMRNDNTKYLKKSGFFSMHSSVCVVGISFCFVGLAYNHTIFHGILMHW